MDGTHHVDDLQQIESYISAGLGFQDFQHRQHAMSKDKMVLQFFGSVQNQELCGIW